MRELVLKPKRQLAKRLRTNATDAETALWRLLRSRRLADMKFRRQVPIGEWIVDFVSFEHRLIVEADGSQHIESMHDARRDKDLSARGFKIMRFWNNDILARPRLVAEAIFQTMALTPSPQPSPTRGEGAGSAVTRRGGLPSPLVGEGGSPRATQSVARGEPGEGAAKTFAKRDRTDA